MRITSNAADRPGTVFTVPPEGFLFGGDYNPEQWPEEVWLDDARLMREAGVNLVSLGVFAWGNLERADGEFDFDWLERSMDILHDHGVAVNLATPTAAPPAWLIQAHPEVMTVNADGVRTGQGGRLGWAPSSATFRRYALRMVDRLARAFADHPALAMWHVSNELGNENIYDFGPETAEAFRAWLRVRYGQVEALNEAWVTAFWGHTVADFAQVEPPRTARTHHNPGLLLDWDRFTSDALLGHLIAERDVLRAITPAIPITTNFMIMRTGNVQDYARWAEEVDVVSNDHYTIVSDPHSHEELAFSADRTRGVAGGAPWMLMEHSTSAVNWQHPNAAKVPGELIRNSISHVAHGADAVCFFQWRQSVGGAEQFHSGMIPHAGVDSKTFSDVGRLGRILRRIGEVAGSRVRPGDVALLWDQEAVWAYGSTRKPSNALTFHDVPLALHRAFSRRHIGVDIIPSVSDLTGYSVVVVPNLFLARAELAERLQSFVSAGGHVLVTYLSGIVDERDQVVLGGYPGVFRDLLGVRVDELYPLPAGEEVRVEGLPHSPLTARDWSEHVETTTAVAIARYADGPLHDAPAITRRRVGDGTATYVSTRLDDLGMQSLADDLIRVSDLQPLVAEAPPFVELTVRETEAASYAFLINHGTVEAQVELDGTDLVTGGEFGCNLPAGDVAIVRLR